MVQAADVDFATPTAVCRPGGSRFWNRRASRLARRFTRSPLAKRAFPRGALVNSVSGRLVCRVVKSDPILGVTLC